MLTIILHCPDAERVWSVAFPETSTALLVLIFQRLSRFDTKEETDDDGKRALTITSPDPMPVSFWKGQP
jgi:hypothetical protein